MTSIFFTSYMHDPDIFQALQVPGTQTLLCGSSSPLLVQWSSQNEFEMPTSIGRSPFPPYNVVMSASLYSLLPGYRAGPITQIFYIYGVGRICSDLFGSSVQNVESALI